MREPVRVGQLFMVGLKGGTLPPGEAAVIAAHHFGSATFVTVSTDGVIGVRTVTDAVQSLASAKTTGGVRFLVSANQEGGDVQALQGPGFSTIPPATRQGQMRPAALVRAAASWGRELRAAGVNMNLAPVMDVVPAATASQNQPIGQLHREYGYDPVTVGVHGAAFIAGMAESGVATTAKHFPGLGRVVGNTDFTAHVVDRVTTPTDPYLGSFRAAIRAGVPFVMVSLATYTRIDAQHLAVFSPTIMQTMLRHDLGFSGVIVSDDLGSAVAVSSVPPGTRAIDFLDAGGDLIVSKTAAAAVPMEQAVLSRTRTDPAFKSVVDAAVRLVLLAKERLGLLPCGQA
jgi:beta-N-acetylhexosaminidase